MRRLVAFLLSCVLFFGGLDVNAYFSDVDRDAWYTEAIDYVYSRGIMTGTGCDKFEPNVVFSRAMLAQVLYRLDGCPYVAWADDYSDVHAGSWYYDAVRWARANGIMSGYGHNLFGPDDRITREQLAVTLYRYDCLDGEADLRVLTLFHGGVGISDWAIKGMAWAAGHGFMSGSNHDLMPFKGATRAEVAMVLMRYLEYEPAQDDSGHEDSGHEDSGQVDSAGGQWQHTESYIYARDGLVRFRYVGDKELVRARIRLGGYVTTYVLSNDREYVYTFPYGPGSYDLTLYEHKEGSKYKQVLCRTYDLTQAEFDRSMVSGSEFYDVSTRVGSVVDRLWDCGSSDYDNVRSLYEWVSSNVRYDYVRKDSVQFGYTPDVGCALFERKGICLDYAGLMCSMLRYKNIRSQIVLGKWGNEGHAWCMARVDGRDVYMDPTFGANMYSVRDKFFDMNDRTYAGYSEEYRY